MVYFPLNGKDSLPPTNQTELFAREGDKTG